ncbi:uncharacterized protein BT62DRAFT_943202 [Guyanagaster necrorhizus]|uniref:PH domain-containing protein n=1 Tax=Guyanagaster necrorhizus TaxID=856835 RepID=A0A9P7W1G5_9AGAR|nr:uncharacterized protein BT62DRAFT_943202 [Guyanagaster necrorhizus MCA 3950]KAG7450300.1 hypothetical protein BT62DRAFT_943202 [Guyanagaster necrorhizus MCA 3950]
MASHGAAARASLSLSMPYSGIPNSLSSRVVVYQGWVLKKRRKKMQGFARRYFTLYQSGLLSYSFEPGQPTRDQISLHHAAISTAPGRKDIHLDSNTATFHIKCLNTDDFNQWMAAFRIFVVAGAEVRKSNSIRLVSRQQGNFKLSRSGAIADDMSTTIHQLEDALDSLKADVNPKKNHSFMKQKEKKDSASMFGLFKKAQHFASDVGSDSIHSECSENIDPSLSSFQRVRLVLDTLKSQHTALLRSLQTSTQTEAVASAHVSPPAITEEEEHTIAPHSPSISFKPSKRASIATTITDSLSEWFDASDGFNEGAQEFVLDVHAFPDGTEQPSRTLSNDSRSSLDQGEDSSVDTDIAQELGSTRLPSEEFTQPDASTYALQVVRRTHLPAPPVGDEGSLFSMLKKNVGKDLSTIAFPVTFNEPLTLLQRAAEEVEYYDLLNQAADTVDPVDRMRYVAAFAVAGYAHTKHRSGRKGFNPMLAETYEDVRMKFISEKVCHNPLEMAYHAEGKNWELYATSAGKTKFWGKSLEIIPLGTTHVKIGKDHFHWKKPSSFMRNLMVGTKYLEHCGKLTIENMRDSSRCVLDFKQSGYWAVSNVVSGILYSSSGDVVSQLEGKWDEQLAETVDSSHLRILWRATPWPIDTHQYYGFTSYGITLNEITDDIVNCLPPTDSRYRPDVRALEEGDLDLAEHEKAHVEELQRDRRRRGEERQARWFKQVGDEWIYIGGYWEARAKGWKDTGIQPLW